jgi:hypothetical protein
MCEIIKNGDGHTKHLHVHVFFFGIFDIQQPMIFPPT